MGCGLKGEANRMGTDARNFSKSIVGFDGMPLTLRDLPSSEAAHWTARRKAEVVLAIHGGLLSLDEASERYALTREEFRTWEVGLETFGLPGLHARPVPRLKSHQRNVSSQQHALTGAG